MASGIASIVEAQAAVNEGQRAAAACALAGNLKAPPPDLVHQPPHYYGRTLQVIDIIENWGLGFHLGNALKYALRAGRKCDRDEDLQKAIWYLRRAERLIPQQLGVARSRNVIEPPRVVEDFNLPGGVDGDLGRAIHAIHRASVAYLHDEAADKCREAAIALISALGSEGGAA